MNSNVVHLPRSNLLEDGYDPNLSKKFTGDEVQSVWQKIDSLAIQEVQKLVLKHEPNLANDLSAEDLRVRVTKIAQFFLRESARRVAIIDPCRGRI